MNQFPLGSLVRSSVRRQAAFQGCLFAFMNLLIEPKGYSSRYQPIELPKFIPKVFSSKLFALAGIMKFHFWGWVFPLVNYGFCCLSPQFDAVQIATFFELS